MEWISVVLVKRGEYISTSVLEQALSYNVCYCPCTVHLSVILWYMLLYPTFLKAGWLLCAIPSTTVYTVCTISHAIPFLPRLILRYQSVPSLPTLCFLSLPSPKVSNCLPCAIRLCYPRLQLSTLCYEPLLSPCTTVYPVLSFSAISHVLQLSSLFC